MKFCTICLCHNMAMNQKVVGQKLFNAVSTSRKPLVDGRLLLRLHHAVFVVRELHALQSFALAVASVCVFRAVAMRAYTA